MSRPRGKAGALQRELIDLAGEKKYDRCISLTRDMLWSLYYLVRQRVEHPEMAFSLSVVCNEPPIPLLTDNFNWPSGSMMQHYDKATRASEVVVPSIVPKERLLGTFSYNEVLAIVPRAVRDSMEYLVQTSKLPGYVTFYLEDKIGFRNIIDRVDVSRKIKT